LSKERDFLTLGNGSLASNVLEVSSGSSGKTAMKFHRRFPCLVDDRLKEQRLLRQHGPIPKVSDSEVLTMEVVGEFLGLDTDWAIYRYFRRQHYLE
jgi:hypothetical protein